MAGGFCIGGIDTYAKRVCRRRRDGSQSVPLFVLFVLFGQAKRTLKEKNHNVTFPLSYFWYFLSLKSTIKEKYHFSSYLYYIHRKKIIFDRQALRKSAREI